MLEEILNGANASTGMMPESGIGELMKALEAGSQISPTGLSGGGALRLQSLDTTMQATVAENKHFALFNRLPKPKATATVDEWTEQSGLGGFLGGSSNGESDIIRDATGDYRRRTGQVKFLMQKRSVSLVANIQNGIAGAEAVEQQAGAKALVRDAEYLLFHGDSSVVPTEFDGIWAQMEAGVASGLVDGGNIIDLDGGTISDYAPIATAAMRIASDRNFGTPTDLFMSMQTQADLDASLQPAYRVGLTDNPAALQLGAPVTGIRTSAGNIATTQDIYIRDEERQVPFQVDYPALAVANDSIKPTLAVGTPATVANSRFTSARAGNYYWLVAGVNAAGQSTGVISAQTAIAAGQGVALTITASAGGQETGYVIYRSRQNGTNAPADFREMVRIPKTGATTTWTDGNWRLPGSTKAALLDLLPSDTAIVWRQYLPMLRFNLYPTNTATIPWAQLLFGYLRMSKLRQHVMFKNITPKNANWRPHVAGA